MDLKSLRSCIFLVKIFNNTVFLAIFTKKRYRPAAERCRTAIKRYRTAAERYRTAAERYPVSYTHLTLPTILRV